MAHHGESSLPTKNPRVAVTLKPSTDAVLRALSRLSKRSVSGIIGDMVEQGVPIFERVVRLMQAAQDAKEGASARVVEGLGAAQDHIEAQLGLIEGDLTARTGDLLNGLEDIQRRGRSEGASRAAAAPRPPLLTGGVDTPANRRGIRRVPRAKVKRRGRHGA